MWCEHCQTDVATQISDDAAALLCTSCGQIVKQIFAPSLHPETRSAREILERWAEEQQLRRASALSAESTPAADVPATLSTSADSETAPSTDSIELTSTEPEPTAPPKLPEFSDTHAEPQRAVPPPAAESSPKREQKWRVDNEHTAPSGPRRPVPAPKRRQRPLEPLSPAVSGEQVDTSAKSVPASHNEGSPEDEREQPMPDHSPALPGQIRLDTEHAAIPAPHFDARTVRARAAAQPGRAESTWGQLLAYAGVGMLSIGTMLVLWGYFGEIARYASTGWLLATAGQMLLLLGIVTLVSGGMQQTTHEVSERIEHLGGRIIRIEESTEKILKGPHFSQKRRQRGTSRSTASEGQDAA